MGGRPSSEKDSDSDVDSERRPSKLKQKNKRRKCVSSPAASTNSSTFSATPSIVGRAETAQTLDLTGSQLAQIEKLWRQVRGDSNEVGATIFRRIFAKSPTAKRLFLARSMGSQRYDEHIGGFLRTLDCVIGSLSDLDAVSARLTALGRRHVDLRGEGFEPRLWNVFAEAMISCSLLWGSRQQRTHALHIAWTKIVLFVIDRMRDGYYSELRCRRKQSGRSTDGDTLTPSAHSGRLSGNDALSDTESTLAAPGSLANLLHSASTMTLNNRPADSAN